MTRLVAMETRLLLRDPAALVYVFAFPLLTASLLGQVYGPGGPEFEGIAPSTYYAYAYVGVVAAAMALVTLPGHLSTYKATGVALRFRNSRFGPHGLQAATVTVSFMTITLAAAALLATSALVFGLPAVVSGVSLLANFIAGSAAMIGLGVLISQLSGSARSAQGLGLAVFFPSFLLGGGGPPPVSMGSALQSFSEFLPLTHMIRGMQESALPLAGNGWEHVAASLGFAGFFWVAALLLGQRKG